MVKFGIIGCGLIGTRHAEKLGTVHNAELVAVCDELIDKAKAIGEKHQCNFYTDYKEMLQKEKMDVVNVCTPNYLHAVMTIDSLKAGCHVLCEKPQALTTKDADDMIRVEKETGKKIFVVKQNRFNPPVKAVKELIKHNKLGKLLSVDSTIYWNRNPQYYEQSAWRGTKDKDGGTLFTQCSHFLDLMLWIGGDVRSVVARMHNLNHSTIEIEDTGSLLLQFANGASGNMKYTTSAYNRNKEGSITVLGEKGFVKIGGEYLNTLEAWDVEGMEKPILETGNPANDYGTYKGSMSNHELVFENVVRSLMHGEEPTTPSHDGRRSIEAIEAAYLSSQSGKEVLLPLQK